MKREGRGKTRPEGTERPSIDFDVDLNWSEERGKGESSLTMGRENKSSGEGRKEKTIPRFGRRREDYNLSPREGGGGRKYYIHGLKGVVSHRERGGLDGRGPYFSCRREFLGGYNLLKRKASERKGALPREGRKLSARRSKGLVRRCSRGEGPSPQ